MIPGDLCRSIDNDEVYLAKTFIEKTQCFYGNIILFELCSIGIIIVSLENKDNDCYVLTPNGIGWCCERHVYEPR